MTNKEIKKELEEIYVAYPVLVSTLRDCISQRKAVWSELRRSFKTDVATDRAYDNTPIGEQEADTRMSMRLLDRKITMLRAMIDVSDE
jgi:hypothetical protein